MAQGSVLRNGGRRVRSIVGWTLLVVAAFATLPFILLLLASPADPQVWGALVAALVVAALGGRLAFADER